MRNDLVITNVRKVFEGEFKPGELAPKNMGRYSDGFVLFVYGEAEYTFDDCRFTADEKSFFYLAKDSIYGIKILKKTKYICVDFDFVSCDEPRKSCVFHNVSPTVKNDFLKLFYIWNKKDLWHIPQAMELLYSLYSEGIRAENRYAGQKDTFAHIASFVLARYTDPDFSVEDIAAHADLSQVHLRRVFKNALNTSPVRYVNFLRLEKAKNMLTASNFTIAEIALSVGFRDPYYFSRLFKKEVGITPMEYRKRGS